MWGLTTRTATSLVSTLPAGMSVAVMGTASCRLRIFASKAEPVPAEPTCADIEFELDRDDPDLVDKSDLWEPRKAAPLEAVDLETEFDRDDPEMADKSDLWEPRKAAPLESVDLECEFDRDDPDAVDRSKLWECPPPPQPADIDSEYDLMDDSVKPPRAAAGVAGNTPFGQGGGRPTDVPDPRVGQYRAKNAA